MGGDKFYFRNLDSIRFIAALMVFLAHTLRLVLAKMPELNPYVLNFFMTLSNGEIGVSIFFVLSGFLITFLLISEYEIKNQISLKNFYIRRVLRIWPLYYAVVIFSFFIYPTLKSMIALNNPLPSNVFYHLVFLSNFDVINILKNFAGSDAMSQNITWSVSIEEQFYLFWPLIFVVLPKRAWIYVITVIICASLLFRLLNNDDKVVLYFHTFSVFIDLGIGGLMAYLIKQSVKIRSFFENSSTSTHLILFFTSFNLVYWSNDIFSFPYGEAISRLFISLSFALVIASQAMTQKESVFNLGNLAYANKWGKYTYGIYLIHPIAITILDVCARILHISLEHYLNLIIIGIMAYFLTMFLSYTSYRYYESWFLGMKKKFAPGG